ncbi:MAG TPA: hypothetical protein VF763_15065 [Candidatus Limnocylindrales bacterium]
MSLPLRRPAPLALPVPLRLPRPSVGGLAVRRTTVIGGVVLSLVVGAATIRAAAAWTASSAPLPAPAVSSETLRAQLDVERARSAALQQQLDDLTSRGTQLGAALDAAKAHLATDAATADQLRGQLAAAQARIAAVSRQLAPYQAGGSGQQVVVQNAPASAGTAAPAQPAAPAAPAPVEPGDD